MKIFRVLIFLFVVAPLYAQYTPPPQSAGGTCAALGGDITGTCAASVATKLASGTASQAVVLDASKNFVTLGYGSSSAASTIMQRDANQNVFANNFNAKSADTAGAGSTTTLTAASARTQNLTGTLSQAFKLPDATTLIAGWNYLLSNSGTNTLSIVDNGSNGIGSVPTLGAALVTLLSAGSTNGTWRVDYMGSSSVKAQIYSFGGGFVNGGSTITATIGLPVTAPAACTIIAWEISIPAADTGTATVKFLKKAAGTASPAIGDSINTSGVALASGTHVRSTTLSDFTTLAVSQGDIIAADLITVGGAPTGLTATFECQ